MTDRNFSIPSLGLSYFTPFGDNDLQAFYAGANATLRLDSKEYNYYDYQQFFLYVNARFDLDYLFFKTGYNFRYRNYANLPELTNFRHFVFAQLNKSFETQTTLILETDIGYKSYEPQELYSTSIMGGAGRGGMSGGSSSTMTEVASSEVPPAGQFILVGRISQSLHERVGLFVQYRQQISITDQSGFSNADGYFLDEEIFDDPFSYESKGASTQLTWLLPLNFKLVLGGEINAKNYISEQAYISDDDSVGSGGPRIDDQKSMYINFTKTFFIDRSWLSSLKINLYYNLIRNESNSYWYDYKNSILGAGIQWQL
ncbi:MAG: hypothetical protein E4H13_11480 [Calditrichales bacterium]|nr:MAG: hypothetical protein E4H13_11480 [Calditrichales bacterium]